MNIFLLYCDISFFPLINTCRVHEFPPIWWEWHGTRCHWGCSDQFNFSHKESWQKITATKPWNYPRYCPLCCANEILQKTLWKRRTWWLTLRNPFCTGQHSYTQKCGMTGRAASSWMRKVRCLALHTHTHTHVGPRRPLPFSSESPAPFPHPPLSLSCSLSPMPLIDYRSDKKLRPVKSEPDRTCLFCSQKRTEIKHLWNCCDHNLQNAELLPAVGFPNQRFHNRDAGTTAWKFYLYQNAVILGQGRAFHTVKVPL